VHHGDRGSQYLSIRFTERLAEASTDSSVGSIGDSYDNAFAESIIGLFKTKMITVPESRRRRVRHAGMGRLVKSPPAAGAYRQHPAGGPGNSVFSPTERVGYGGLTQT